jgi:A-kinase anchor protein 18
LVQATLNIILNSNFQEILVEVDAQVAEKERENRKVEIYNKLDAKSFTNFRGQKKFKKSDILSANRKYR